MSNALPITRTRNNLNVLLQPNAIPSTPAVLIDMYTVIKSLTQNSLESALDNIIKTPWQINAKLPAVRTIEHSKRNENHVDIVIPKNGTEYYGIVTSVYMIQLHAITHDDKLVTCVQYRHLTDVPKETITAVYTGDLTIVEDYIKSIGITHSPKLSQETTTMSDNTIKPLVQPNVEQSLEMLSGTEEGWYQDKADRDTISLAELKDRQNGNKLLDCLEQLKRRYIDRASKSLSKFGRRDYHNNVETKYRTNRAEYTVRLDWLTVTMIVYVTGDINYSMSILNLQYNNINTLINERFSHLSSVSDWDTNRAIVEQMNALEAKIVTLTIDILKYNQQ